MDTRDLLTPIEVAEYTGYSVRSLARWRAQKLIRSVGLDRRPRYRRGDVDDLLLGLSQEDPSVTSEKAGHR